MVPTQSRRLAALAALLALTWAGLARADIIFLKDGTVLTGRVHREGTEEVDPYTHEPIFMPKGFFLLDDYARRVYFSPGQVRLVQPKDYAKEEFLYAEKDVKLLEPRPMPQIVQILRAPDFDPKTWERKVSVRTPRFDLDLQQRIVAITPSLATVCATKTYAWTSLYSTRELNPENVKELLANHKKYQPKKDETNDQKLLRRLKYCDFFVQAGWYDEAERELAKLTKEMPDYKDRIEEARAQLGGLQAREYLEGIKRLIAGGQRQGAKKKIEEFPKKYAGDKLLADLREIKSGLTTEDARLKLLNQALTELAKDVKGADKDTFVNAARAIRNELHADTVGRLETFLTQARQYARQKDDGKTPIQSPEKLLSLAVSGWLLGAVSSEASPDHAVRLWRTRQMVLDYQRATSADERKKMLASYLKDKAAAVPLDEIAQMIPQLPPPEPPEKIDTKPAEKTIGAGRGAIKYLLQVPPEYAPGRSYPLVILLCNSGDKPEDVFKRWSAMGAENGYFLAAPTWEGGALGRGGYAFSVREHATVLETIRDLRRHYQIDSDRVFLYGLGQGGLMALDVGLSHPDLFAGVMTMGAQPELYPERYFRNAQYLPLYLVTGSRGCDLKRLRTVVEPWVMRPSYSTIWVDYKGRGPEWFGAELPNLFDWMRGKRRAFPLRQLGTDGLGSKLGNEFTSLRKTDNRFYWLSSDGIADRYTVDPERWNGTVQPATFVGRIDPAENEVYLTVKGMKSVTLWLGRTAKGENMIDWDKPLKVTANLTAFPPRKVEMNLETLLEDLYQRGDKQRLFLARLDYKLTR